MTIAVDLGRKATNQIKEGTLCILLLFYNNLISVEYDIWLMPSFISFMAAWLNISGKRGTSILYLGKTCSAPSLRKICNLFIIMRQ